MASFALNSIVVFFVAIFCLIGHNVEARDGKFFFSKFTHIDNKEVSLTPASVPAQAPSLAQANGRLGDGQFGPGSGMIPQSKESWPVTSTTTTDDEEFEKLMAKFDEKTTEEFDEEDQDMNEQKDKYSNYNDNERGYGNEVEREGMSDRRSWNYENGPSRGGYENIPAGKAHPNEYDTMEEYYKSLEGSQEEYEP